MQYVELSLKSDSRIKFWNVRENPSLLLSGSLGRVNMGILLKFFLGHTVLRGNHFKRIFVNKNVVYSGKL